MDENIIELKNLLNSINEDSDGIEEILQDIDDTFEFVEYLQRLRKEAVDIMDIASGDEINKYRYKSETLIEIIHIIYIFIKLLYRKVNIIYSSYVILITLFAEKL